MQGFKKRGALALLLALMTVVSLVPNFGGAAVTPIVKDIRIYITQEAMAAAGTLSGILITGLQNATDPTSGGTVEGTSTWAAGVGSNIPRFGGIYRAVFKPTNTAAYIDAYYNVTISEIAGYTESSTAYDGGGTAIGPQHKTKAATTLYSSPGGKSIGKLAKGEEVHIMFIVSGMACLVTGGYVEYAALELIHGEKR